MTLPYHTPEQDAQLATLATIRTSLRLTNLERVRVHNELKHTRHMIEVPTTTQSRKGSD